MSAKQGEEEGKFVKKETDQTENYIIQKNTKTKSGFTIILVVIIIILVAIGVSWYFLKPND